MILVSACSGLGASSFSRVSLGEVPGEAARFIDLFAVNVPSPRHLKHLKLSNVKPGCMWLALSVLWNL